MGEREEMVFVRVVAGEVATCRRSRFVDLVRLGAHLMMLFVVCLTCCELKEMKWFDFLGGAVLLILFVV